STPRFSPDGKWISFWVGNPLSSFPDGGDWGTAYIVPASGGDPKRVGADLQYGAYPVWSPDSQHLLVYVNPVLRMPAVDQDWWLISVDGSASRRTGAFAALDRQKIRISDGYVPRAYDWTTDGILFTGTLADTVNCWQIPGPDADGRINGPAERLTEGTTLEVSPVFKGGRLFFASLTRAQNIWAIDADTNRGEAKGAARRLTNGGAELGPSISEDGTQLAFTSSRTKEVDVRLKDLTTGQERTIANSAGAEMRPRITRDGSAVGYTLWQTGNDEIRVVPASGGVSKRITSGSGFVWWVNKERLLFTKRFSDHAILMADLATGTEQVFLEMADRRLFQASFSRDEKWLVAEVTPREKQFSLSRIYVIPAAQNAPVSERDWIPVGHETGWNDKPRWSPDGNSIYFISHEDGFRCLWTQRLDPKTKRPTSPPAAAYHLHDTRVSMLNVGLGMLEIDVAKDKIVFGMGELTGNIWSRNSK
ncbi:MAG TPA: hypothetical protein VEQ63_14785, partial [Bryobacteraceae bacterium]|nr:hypothetical protein [Bryobacteraceae bacterium]